MIFGYFTPEGGIGKLPAIEDTDVNNLSWIMELIHFSLHFKF